MKKINLFFTVFMFTIVLISCSKKTAATGKVASVKSPAPVSSAPMSKSEPQHIDEMTPKAGEIVTIPEGFDPNLLFSIKRTPCFGKCAVYEIQLFADGKATYKGIAFASRDGNFETKVDAQFAKQIADKAMSINYFKMQNKFPEGAIRITDLPTTTTYVRVGSVGKSVENHYEAPKELIEFERWLVVQFDKLNWQRS